MVMTQRTVRRLLQLFTFEEFDAPHTCGRTQVIHDRVGFVESFSRDDMLVSDALVLVGRRRAVAMKPDVMLPRNLTESLIKWHNFVPLVCHPERQRDVASIIAGYTGTNRACPERAIASRTGRISRHSRTKRGPENS